MDWKSRLKNIKPQEATGNIPAVSTILSDELPEWGKPPAAQTEPPRRDRQVTPPDTVPAAPRTHCQARKVGGRICGALLKEGVNGFLSCSDPGCQVPVTSFIGTRQSRIPHNSQTTRKAH